MTIPLRAVLDSYAILCFLKAERGADHVERYLEAALHHKTTLFLNMINAGEIFYITYRRVGEQKAFEVWGYLKNLPLHIIQNDENLVLMAAHFKGRFSLSYADAFAATTAQTQKAALVTGDPEFKPLSKEIEIDWLPHPSSF